MTVSLNYLQISASFICCYNDMSVPQPGALESSLVHQTSSPVVPFTLIKTFTLTHSQTLKDSLISISLSSLMGRKKILVRLDT